MDIFLQATCAFLLSVGIMFVFIESRSKFERALLYFGISTILLCLFVGIDIWLLSTVKQDQAQFLYWLRVQHILACSIVPFLFTYLLLLTHSFSFKKIAIIIFIITILSILFLTDLMFYLKKNVIEVGFVYTFIFFPVSLILLGYILFTVVSKIRSSLKSEKKILYFHLPGMATLIFFGTVDIITVINNTGDSFTYSLLGVLFFVAMTTYAFTERLTQLINERKRILGELRSAYKDLESANTLKQIGQSTAIINHEIKNYMFIISGNAEFIKIKESLSEKGKELLDVIIDTCEHLLSFSKDILDLSKAEILKDKDKKRINLNEVIKKSLAKHFPQRMDSIELIGFEDDHYILGDWSKIDHVFLNMLNNAFDAEANNIKISLLERSSILCLSIEDDGAGFTGDNFNEIFNAFYTTKKDKGGTGLGLSIVRAIIESHGGHISAYILNSINSSKTGIKFDLTFPIFKRNMSIEFTEKDNVILIKDGIENINELLRIFQNVNFKPYIVQDISEVANFKNLKNITTILADTGNATEVKSKYHQIPRTCVLKHYQDTFYIINTLRDPQPEIFSEEYILSNFK